MRKISVLIPALILLQMAFSNASAQRFMECDYQESLIEVVPDSFICGYTFSPTGYKPYGMFLQQDNEGYKIVLNYYKYDRDKVDSEMSSATIRLSEWDAQSNLDNLKKEVERGIEAGATRGQWNASADDKKPESVIRALMPGRAAIGFDEILLGIWYDYYCDFKIELGPEPHPNADRWEVTPYSNMEDYPYHSWIYSNDLSDWFIAVYSGLCLSGCVYVDHWGTWGGVIEEIDSKGNMVNATCSDERGLFRLTIVNPDNSIRVSYKRYDPQRKAYAVYEPYVRVISRRRETGSLAHYVELNEFTYSKHPKTFRKGVVVSGQAPSEASTISGVVMNGTGPVKDAVIAETDSKGNVISKTTSQANGEFTLDISNPQNKLRITAQGYAGVTHAIDGMRFVIILK